MKTSFTFFDIVALICIIVPAVRCLFRGFTKEILSLVGIIGGIILGRMFCGPVGSLFGSWVHYDWALRALGFVVVYFVVNTACSIASLILAKLMKKTPLTAADRLGGLALGVLKGILIVGVFVLLVNGIAGSIDHSFLKTSCFARPILSFMKLLTGIVIPAAKHAASI
jgi:membrane protein required for colicin V production